jgi:hypothetical protein
MPNALTLESMSPELVKVVERCSHEPHRRKSRMREIRSSGSGEGPGWVTARPTLQRSFGTAPAGVPPAAHSTTSRGAVRSGHAAQDGRGVGLSGVWERIKSLHCGWGCGVVGNAQRYPSACGQLIGLSIRCGKSISLKKIMSYDTIKSGTLGRPLDEPRHAAVNCSFSALEKNRRLSRGWQLAPSCKSMTPCNYRIIT